VVAQTQAGLTRMLLDELFAVRTASVEALIGARHQADTLYESVVFAVGGVATLPDCLRGGRTPSPRAVHNVLLRDYFTSHAFSAVLFVVDGSKNHEQGSLLRGTRQFVTRHKAFCYAAQGRPLRGTSSLLRDIMWFGHTRHATWAQYMRCQLPCVSMTMPKSHRV